MISFDKIYTKISKKIASLAKRLFTSTLRDDKSLKSNLKEFESGALSVLSSQGLDDITLSKRIYKSVKIIEKEATKVIKEHLKANKSVKDLAKKLYEGYNFKDDPLKIKPKLPKYLVDEAINLATKNAKKLKTPALRTAYLEALKARDKAEYEKKLKIALYEKGRYYASRIALTEANLEYAKNRALEYLADESLEVVKFKMSAKHPRPDICDYFANTDFYGLGKGMYPKEKAPTLPLHPFCMCSIIPKYSLSSKGAKFNPNAGRDYINSLNEHRASQIIGSRDRLIKFTNGADFLDMYNAKKPPRYKIGEIGDLLKDKDVLISRWQSGLDWMVKTIANKNIIKEKDKQVIQVGILAPAILNALSKLDIKPLNDSVSIYQNTINHILRDAKPNIKKPSVDEIKGVVNIIDEAKHCFYDKLNKNIVFYAPSFDDKSRILAIAINLDFTLKKFKTDNFIATISKVPKESYRSVLGNKNDYIKIK